MGSDMTMKHDLCNLALKAEVTEAVTNNGKTVNLYLAKPKHMCQL
jgi:hypothetical protein